MLKNEKSGIEMENYEEIPTGIDFVEITRENFCEILECRYSDKNYIFAVSFAEVGAMGSAGEVKIVVRDEDWNIKGYKTNYMFGVLGKIDIDDWYTEQNLVFALVPILKDIDFNRYLVDRNGRMIRHDFEIDIWTVVDMEFGNHFLGSCIFGCDMAKKFAHASTGEMWENWEKATAEYAYEMRQWKASHE